MSKTYWGLLAFVVILAAIVIGGLLMPPTEQVKKQSKQKYRTTEELVAAAKQVQVGDPAERVLQLLGEPYSKTNRMENLETWSYRDVAIAIYKGKVCGIQGCGILTRGEMIPPELQLKVKSTPGGSCAVH